MKYFEVTKTATVPFGKAEAVIRLHGFIPNQQYGGLGLNISKKIEILFLGKVVTNDTYAYTYDYPNSNELQREFIEDSYVNNKWDKQKSYTRIGKASTEGLVGKEINKMMKSFEAEIEEEYAVYSGLKSPAKKAEEERQEEMAIAQSIIEKAKAIGIDKLPTAAEAQKQLKIYNDVMNEGGEGYLPTIITKEMYEQAKAELREM